MKPKRFILMLLTLALAAATVCALAGCAGQSSSQSSSSSASSSSESSSGSSSSSSDSSSSASQSSDNPISSMSGDNAGILIAYFSATGNTERVADVIHETIGGDLYAIQPAQPYSEQDLTDYYGDTRPTAERDDPGIRPQIASEPIQNIDQYDIVFLGYPIWYDEAPNIIDTFLESYNFDGIAIYPFCTSGSSDIKNSVDLLMPLAGGAAWQPGMRFASDASAEQVRTWVEGLGLV